MYFESAMLRHAMTVEDKEGSEMLSTPTLEVGSTTLDEICASVCLICAGHLDIANSLNIFYTSLPRNGDPLASFVLKVLGPATVDLRSSHICLRCYELFRTLEEAQWTASNVRCEILKVYSNRRGVDQDRISSEEIQVVRHEDPFDKKDGTSLDAESLKCENNTTSFERAVPTSVEPQALEDSTFHRCNANGPADSSLVAKTTLQSNVFKPEHSSRLGSEGLSAESPSNPVGSEMGGISSDESADDPTEVKSHSPDTWRSGRMSKYSQKPLKYSCTTCDKKWRTSADLKTHVRSHSRLRPYMCDKCGQAYKHKQALEIHVGMHNGISPFKCHVCDKCFTQKGALMRHLPMHTGETPYQCELCGKRFVHHTSYNMHTLSHTGKKSYQCHVCNLSLLSTSHLKRHMRVHTGEKPYTCSLCDKSFAERYNLFAHQKIHDPEKVIARAAKRTVFKCDRCDEHFDKKQKLDKHTREHESNEGTRNKEWTGHTIEVESHIGKTGLRIHEIAAER